MSLAELQQQQKRMAELQHQHHQASVPTSNSYRNCNSSDNSTDGSTSCDSSFSKNSARTIYCNKALGDDIFFNEEEGIEVKAVNGILNPNPKYKANSLSIYVSSNKYGNATSISGSVNIEFKTQPILSLFRQRERIHTDKGFWVFESGDILLFEKRLDYCKWLSLSSKESSLKQKHLKCRICVDPHKRYKYWVSDIEKFATKGKNGKVVVYRAKIFKSVMNSGTQTIAVLESCYFSEVHALKEAISIARRHNVKKNRNEMIHSKKKMCEQQTKHKGKSVTTGF